jgi:methyl-accepting chemotaxis protein
VARYRAVIVRTANACEAAAAGDLEARVLDHDSKDEDGRLMCGVNAVLDVSDAFVREAGAALSHARAGRYFRRVLLRGMPGAYRQGAMLINRAMAEMQGQARAMATARTEQLALAEQFEQAIKTVAGALASSATEMQATASTLTTVATAATGDAVAVSSAAGELGGRVHSMASAAEQVTASLRDVNRHAATSESMTQQVRADVGVAEATIGRLTETSRHIGRITNLITQIAGQTKLLALNATIEAARAGEAGKGFAVVASEVKTLAQSTGAASGEIAEHIGAVQQNTADAVAAIGGISRAVAELQDAGAAMAASVQEQGQATREISRHVQQAAQHTERVNSAIAQVSAAVTSTSDAAREMLAVAGEVSTQAEGLLTAVDAFLSRLRA